MTAYLPATDTGVHRLEELLRVANTADPDKIDMDHWGHIDAELGLQPEQAEWSHISGKGFNDVLEFKFLPCGTSACLLGTAAFDPYFKAQGMKMLWRAIEDGETEDGKTTYEYQGTITFDGDEINRIEFFDLPGAHIRFWTGKQWEDADDFLFMPHSYRDAEQYELKGEDLKAALIEHIERVLGYLKSPDTTKGWKDSWTEKGASEMAETAQAFEATRIKAIEEDSGGTFVGYADEDETIGIVVHKGPPA